jgi:hypothetical protein
LECLGLIGPQLRPIMQPRRLAGFPPLTGSGRAVGVGAGITSNDVAVVVVVLLGNLSSPSPLNPTA